MSDQHTPAAGTCPAAAPACETVPAVLVLAHDPDRRWTERFLLATSPLWILAVAWVVLTGTLRAWDDADYLVFGCAVAAPAAIGPLLARGRPDAGRRPWHGYWFKLNLWVAIVVAFGTYFGTHYFFDYMGMRYAFGARWTFEAVELGHSGQRVPVFMYPLTHAYFMTYFAILMVADRTAVARLGLGRDDALPRRLGRAAVVLALAYGIAFAETFFMATELLRDLFAYGSRERMLAVGSFGYAVYFVIGLPVVRRIDGDPLRWPLLRVVGSALATCMAILVALELWAQLIGPL